MLTERFGKMPFTLPLWIIVLTAAVCAGTLLLFTAVSYRRGREAELIEQVRAEAV